MKTWRIEALILAIGMVLAGSFIMHGISNYSASNRTVNVKGLAEMEVKANKVTWPLTYKVMGNDLISLYNKIEEQNATIVAFLKAKGISMDEISQGAPEITDNQAERYGNNNTPYRYFVTVVITVTSKQVDLIRELYNQQSELLKQDVAIITGYENRISFDYTDLNKIKPKMIEEATKNARVAAEKFAKDSGSKLGSIQHAYQGQFSIYDRDSNTPYIKQIRVVTTIDYLLED